LILFLCKTGRPLLELDEEEGGRWGGGGVTISFAITGWNGRGEGRVTRVIARKGN